MSPGAPALALAALLVAPDPARAQPEPPAPRGFVGVNLLAPLPAFLPVPLSTLTSVFSGLETGLGVNGGVPAGRWTRVEGRLAAGPNSDAEWLFHLGAWGTIQPLGALGRRPENLYVGAGLRAWDLRNGLTDVDRFNLAAALAVGHRFDLGRAWLDLRAQEILGVCTWTSDPHTEPGFATVADPWMPKVPLITLDLGVDVR